MITSRPELLAPAGTPDALKAALTAGADAVYLGVEDFNARRNAENFNFEHLAEACDLAHLANRRIYLTLNTAILPSETERAMETARHAWDAGVDALIVQDLGLLARLAREMPQFELHASTQMNLHSAAAVRAAASLGATRVTLARELSLAELSAIAREGVPLEVFAHGALCVCYSGQCLLSSLVGRRSANRGLCAQACRLPYRLIDTSTGKSAKAPGEHLLSPADLATIDILPALIATGIASLKIEGRMKSAVYVAAVTRAYREALDRAFAEGEAAGAADAVGAVGAAANGMADEAGALEGAKDGSAGTDAAPAAKGDDPQSAGASQPSALSALSETFSRGFTTAYLEGERGNAMMSYTQPNNRGVAVGRVGALKGGLVAVDLTRSLTRGDVLAFRTSRGQTVVTLDDFWLTADATGESPREAAANARVYLRVTEPVSKGDRVFRVRSAALLDEVESGFDNTVFQGNNGLVALDAQVVLRQGQPAELGFRVRGDERQHQEATSFGDTVEAARTKPLTAEDIREHVGRVGGTPFTITGWDIQLDEGVGMGFSALHRLRAEALDSLTDKLLSPWRTRSITPLERAAAHAPAQKGKPRIAAIVCNEAGARAAAQGGAELIYLHSLQFEATGGAAEADEAAAGAAGAAGAGAEMQAEVEAEAGTAIQAPSAGKLPHSLPVIRLLPAITHDRELPALEKHLLKDGQAAVVNNLGELEVLRACGHALEAGPSLGICNDRALELFADLGMTQAWLSPELSQRDIAQLSPTAPVPLALTVFGQQEVMVTEHCLLMAEGPCDQRCARCSRRKAPRLLEDRKGYRLPVRTDNAGRSHLFNAVPLDLIPSMPELVSLGVSTLVVDGTLLTTKDLKAEVARAVRARDLAVRGAGSLPKREGHTTGHFFRGVF